MSEFTHPELRPVAVVSDTAKDDALADVGAGCEGKDGEGYKTSAHGPYNNGYPEYWCSDYVIAMWEKAGANVDGLDANAALFYNYGEYHHTLHDKPQVGDAVVFNYEAHGGYQGGPKASHVAIVTKLYDDGSIDTVSGDWGGGGDPSQFPGAVDPDQAAFASTATAQVNKHWDPTADSPLGVGPVSGFISPVAPDPGAGLNLDSVPNLGVRAGQGQLLVAVAHPATLHSGGEAVITGSNSIFVGPDQSPLAGHGDRTQDGGIIVDRSNDNIYMS